MINDGIRKAVPGRRNNFKDDRIQVASLHCNYSFGQNENIVKTNIVRKLVRI